MPIASFFNRFLLYLVLFMALSGCGGKRENLITPLRPASEDSAKQAEDLVSSDPAGKIAQPRIPQELSSSSAPVDSSFPGNVNYNYSIICLSPEAPELSTIFLSQSLLARMADSPPVPLATLEQRLAASLKEGKDILHSQGYYAGEVGGSFEDEKPISSLLSKTALFLALGDKAIFQDKTPHKKSSKDSASLVANIVFIPGPRYTIGKSSIKDETQAQKSNLPSSLADTGLASGSNAVAANVMEAVAKIRDAYRNNGYPEASQGKAQYFLNHDSRTLDVEVYIKAGRYTRMGNIAVKESGLVSQNYLEGLQTWTKGIPWDQSKLENYRDALRQCGLFQSIEVGPSTHDDPEGLRPVELSLQAGKQRTVGGLLQYDTSFGPGLEAYWENRNFSGQGDLLRLELPIWGDVQALKAGYRLPFFMHPSQNFIAQAGLLNKDTAAYSVQGANISAGLERVLNKHWSASIQAGAEGGSLKDAEKPRREYLLLGLPLGAVYQSTNSLLDPTEGSRIMFSLTPYNGEYHGNFSALRSRIDYHKYLPVLDNMTLALRASGGVLNGQESANVPPSVRFYSGGGGSVRGYEYQSIGPRNAKRDPLGGAALLECSLENRWRISDEWGLVSFIDGGSASEAFDTGISNEMRWGAGIGGRFYTAVGPLRLDLATPLNPRESDKSLQIYMSIGQSF